MSKWLGTGVLQLLLLVSGCGEEGSTSGATGASGGVGNGGEGSGGGSGGTPASGGSGAASGESAGGSAGSGGVASGGTPSGGAGGAGGAGGEPTTTSTTIERGDDYFGTPERFNRYVTDPDWTPSRTIYVSRTGSGEGASRTDPASVDEGFEQITAGERLFFLRDAEPYAGCWELESEDGGTYDEPIVIYAERNDDGSRGVRINCCDRGRRTCINLEGANYVAVDGFELAGARYGIRAVGLGYESAEHQRGIAMLNNEGLEQCADPFFTGQSDWIVLDGNIARGGGSCDGHGIYLSNGSDWMVVRNNELYDNDSSDFQINADPAFTCTDRNIDYDDPRCDGSALDGLGRGVSEFVLVENNYFHNGNGQGPNFTSVRNSIVRNNVIGLYDRHGTSFWQETDNPNLGSSDNRIHHNLFIGDNRRHVLQFNNHSDRNDVRNNVFVGVSIGNASVATNEDPILVEIDTGTTSANVFVDNFYSGGRFDGHSPGAGEYVSATFDALWFTDFPLDRMGTAEGFRPTASAPYLDSGELLDTTPTDLAGKLRTTQTDLGPFER